MTESDRVIGNLGGAIASIGRDVAVIQRRLSA
jgi:hypothetical protein